MRNPRIKTFFTERQVCTESMQDKSLSRSPQKPSLLMKRLKKNGYIKLLEVEEQFKPISKEDFLLAHTAEYVDNVFNKTGNYGSNMLPWSQNLVDSLPYTTASLYEAKKYAILHPETVCFAPVSGMHHATPTQGMGFCTFSGQVISAIKIYQEFGKSCAYFDLDGHFGNSIEDSRYFNELVDKAIPLGCNINPDGKNADYLADFEKGLAYVKTQIEEGKVHYVVFAHGADSHAEDDLGHQCDTEHWVACATMFAHWVNEVSAATGRTLPVVLALFGGYRSDHYDAVLDLHTKSLIACSNIICGNNYTDNLVIPSKNEVKLLAQDSLPNTQQPKFNKLQAFIGITMVLGGLLINFAIAPYQNLQFPLDLLCIESLAIGLVILTLIKTVAGNSYANIGLPLLVVLHYLSNLLLEVGLEVEIHDFFLQTFRFTYPIAIVALCFQFIKPRPIISVFAGLLWFLANTIEVAVFLENRQGAVEYAKEPTSIWPFVAVSYLIALWIVRKWNELNNTR